MLNRFTIAKLLLIVLSCLIGNKALHAQSDNIRSINFNEYTYSVKVFVPYFDGQWMGWQAKLTEGKKENKNSISVSLGAVEFSDINNDGDDEAIVILDLRTSMGTMGRANNFYVFDYQEGLAVPIFHVFKEKVRDISFNGQILTITSPYWQSSDPHCCPSQLEIATYGWNGKKIDLLYRDLNPIDNSGDDKN